MIIVKYSNLNVAFPPYNIFLVMLDLESELVVSFMTKNQGQAIFIHCRTCLLYLISL